ncbi:E3 ubiquitin-protein ligase CCNB1IP1-like [Dreissena polymorpha]|uniref:RING-type domain-containing protein n=1 Tax=Dreissena polymorpha TaxID=45954 RepID=A0A9D4FCZ3_DREPO|nr:E3 ubiquitin-protein ligase CCNB1IP1-like [Dreissena polymorpha]XP_052219642.1 E3 ubiquitin-protein ligase CCNB1IP1-like [Dreissena polymorpha]XP_052219643.1 E3 ubiquitin-protein ligase CCNB1IP1-like [Dreissena polymorpha]KAH3796480.1 hypothetical protein DPMN_150048 [Dreissena polymorpha]
MEGDDLICNFKKCRKRLTDIAYVTACSHVFCDEDGTREFNRAKNCPACKTNLDKKFEIVRNNLQPSEQYKSMILAGLKPDMINEIASRALAFWMYQSHQEKTYHEFQSNKERERASQLEQYYEQLVSRTNSELTSLKSQIENTKKENGETKKKYSEVSDKLMEKNRQHQKLQSMYDSLRRKYISISSFETVGVQKTPNCAFNVPNMASGDMRGASHVQGTMQRGRASSFLESFISPPQGFQFNPQQAMLDQPANRVHDEFSVGLGTPRR